MQTEGNLDLPASGVLVSIRVLSNLVIQSILTFLYFISESSLT